jgi:uncharacterized coiled-coil DUF342 family protein
MEQLTKQDKETYLSVFLDILLFEINCLQDKSDDPAMWNYQIEVLKKADPVRFAKKIKELRVHLVTALKKWRKNHHKIEALYAELAVYKNNLAKINH